MDSDKSRPIVAQPRSLHDGEAWSGCKHCATRATFDRAGTGSVREAREVLCRPFPHEALPTRVEPAISRVLASEVFAGSLVSAYILSSIARPSGVVAGSEKTKAADSSRAIRRASSAISGLE